MVGNVCAYYIDFHLIFIVSIVTVEAIANLLMHRKISACVWVYWYMHSRYVWPWTRLIWVSLMQLRGL